LENQWNLLKEIKATNHGLIEATAEVPVDSDWFSGHFPDEPILPGIALIHLVEQAVIQDALCRGMMLRIRALKRVKFLRPVRPGDVLTIIVDVENAQKDLTFSFKITDKENMVCSGSMIAIKNN